MKIIFFGTPEYVLPILSGLHKEYNKTRDRELIGVVTQAPKPVGREQKIEYSEVDHFAHKHNIPIYFDASELPEADLGVCAAYGKIIPQEALDKFSLGIINIHPSLLPQWRGTSPTQATIVSGVEETGVTIIKTDKEMDHGPIVSFFKSNVLPTDTNETLRARLFEESVEFLLDLIPSYAAGKTKLKEQDHSKATYTKPIVKDDGFIEGKYIEKALSGESISEDWEIRFLKDFVATPNAKFIESYIRALAPWPGTFTNIITSKDKNETKRLKIISAHIEEGKLVLDEVQLEGKNPVSWVQFKTGYPQFSWQK